MTGEHPFRLVIMAAGKGSRWGNHGGTPKHLIEIDGEPLLHRTVRLFGEYTDDIVVVAHNARYAVEGASLWRPKPMPELVDAQKYLDAREIWPVDKETMLVYGDVWYSEAAVETISIDPERQAEMLGWVFFGRRDASVLTGKPYGELFAVRLTPNYYIQFERELQRQAAMRRAGKLWRNSGWELYRGLATDLQPQGPHGVTNNFVEINDRTDDFDVPADLSNWKALA